MRAILGNTAEGLYRCRPERDNWLISFSSIRKVDHSAELASARFLQRFDTPETVIKELEKSCLGEDVDLKISSRQSSVRILSMREEVTLRND